MQTTPPPRRTALTDFLFDLLDFVEEKINEAVADPMSRAWAIEEAACAMPVMFDRLSEDEGIGLRFVLVLGNKIEKRYWPDWWDDFAKMEDEEFLREAGELTRKGGALHALRAVLKQ
jgi:hypothetical protein